MVEPFRLDLGQDIFTRKEYEMFRALETISAQMDEWLKIYRSTTERMFQIAAQDPECKACIDKVKEKAN